jgi:hypothetical protein
MNADLSASDITIDWRHSLTERSQYRIGPDHQRLIIGNFMRNKTKLLDSGREFLEQRSGLIGRVRGYPVAHHPAAGAARAGVKGAGSDDAIGDDGGGAR